MPYYVYMAQNNLGKLYVGVSQNPTQRLNEHNTRRGSIYTKAGDFKIVFLEEYNMLPEARKREIQIKKWRRDKKENLMQRYKQELPTNSFMTIWDGIYKHYKKTGEPYANIEAPLSPTFLGFIEGVNLPSKRALDIGFGTGTYLKYLQDKGFEVEGIDSSETAVAIAKKLLGENAKVTLVDMYAYQLEANSYGLILSVSAMTHGKKQQVESLVGKIYNALVPGGKFFLTLIATWNKEETIGKVEFIGDGEFILREGPEKGLVHNSYMEEEIRQLLSQFNKVTIQEDSTSSAAKKWVVIAEK